MDLLSVINTGLTAINDVRSFSQSITQAEVLRGKLQSKLSSTQLILDNIKGIADYIARAEDDRASDTSGSDTVDLHTSNIRSLFQQNDIQLEAFRKTVQDIQNRFNTRSNAGDTTTIAGKIKRVIRGEKEEREILLFLEDLSEVKETASVIRETLSM